MVRSRAIPISGDTGINVLRDKILEGDLVKAAQPGELITRNDVLTEQLKHDLRFADLNKIKPLKIVADPASGMGAQYLEVLFSALPVELVKMNFAIDGTFPVHEADPIKPENVRDLEELVVSEQADLGIAIDGDGDRIFFVDNNGQVVNQAIIRGILAKIFLRDKPGAKIAYDVRPGKITDDLIRENGGLPIITRVGHSLIKEQVLKEGAYFAGESSGHFFLNMDIGCFEVPLIVVLKLLQEFSESGQSVSEYIKPYERYFSSGEINSNVLNKEGVLKALAERYSDGQINNLDGISIAYPDFWFNVRGSNTENTMRLNLEARSREIMEQKRDEVLRIIRG
jgi:phosphomannomutase